MRKGSISIDFLLSLSVALSILVLFFPLAYMQLEDSIAFGLHQKAESMSAGVGSAINHFHAIDGKKMNLSLKDPSEPGSSISSEGFAFVSGSTLIKPVSCNVTLNNDSNFVETSIGYERAETGTSETVSAKYPALVSNVSTSKNVFDCNETIVMEEKS